MLILIFLILLVLPFLLFPSCPNHEQHVDVLIVLGCPTEDDGTLTPTQKKRIKKAVFAIQKYKIQTCITTGGSAHNAFNESKVMGKELLKSCDVHLIYEDQSKTTYENMLFCKQICEQHQFKTIGIVTSRLHATRAYAMSKKFFDDIVMFKAADTYWPKKLFRECLSRYQYLYIEIKNKCTR